MKTHLNRKAKRENDEPVDLSLTPEEERFLRELIGWEKRSEEMDYLVK